MLILFPLMEMFSLISGCLENIFTQPFGGTFLSILATNQHIACKSLLVKLKANGADSWPNGPAGGGVKRFFFIVSSPLFQLMGVLTIVLGTITGERLKLTNSTIQLGFKNDFLEPSNLNVPLGLPPFLC